MRAVCLATPVEEPHRFAAAQAHFAAVGLTSVEYFHGLHKSTSGLDTSHLYMVDRPAPDAEAYRIGPHPTNIWLGHYFLWQALKLSGDEYWFIVECDAKFPVDTDWRWHVDWARTEAERRGPWDLIYIGSCCTEGKSHTVVAREASSNDGRRLVQFSDVAPFCNHAYLIHRRSVPILESTLRKVWAPIDIQPASECFRGGRPLPRCVPAPEPSRRLTVYTLLPRLVEQFDKDLPP
jgi:hypothetical protein